MSEPLTPADCEIQGFDWMPIFGTKLFGSTFYAKASDAGFRAAMRLWWSAWQQRPAASLPNDDAALALLADYGRDIKGFLKVKAEALHGFVLCSDGRLYHPLLAQEALAAWDKRRKERERKAEMRSAKARKKDEVESGSPICCPTGQAQEEARDSPKTSALTGQDRTGQDIEVTSSLRSEVATQRAGARGCRLPDDWSPGPEDRAFAQTLSLDAGRVAEGFRDYWHAKPGREAVKLDWPATWRGWCRREAERLPQARQAQRQPANTGLRAAALANFQTIRPVFDLESFAEELPQ